MYEKFKPVKIMDLENDLIKIPLFAEPIQNMELDVNRLDNIWETIRDTKIIAKNEKYGNSVYRTDNIFSDQKTPDELIRLRLDDKLRRIPQLKPMDPKYNSEIMEIIGYLILLLNITMEDD